MKKSMLLLLAIFAIGFSTNAWAKDKEKDTVNISLRNRSSMEINSIKFDLRGFLGIKDQTIKKFDNDDFNNQDKLKSGEMYDSSISLPCKGHIAGVKINFNKKVGFDKKTKYEHMFIELKKGKDVNKIIFYIYDNYIDVAERFKLE